ncbi:hypothetical protein [Veillonella seminalis]|jgi:hypothetical protein|uniref:hypothetical protein n=1 Tax=Veillonella seminalis TaxID=1502943 RepID=UPI002061E23B|nr:MAG TPA: hypothetical protein [Caudoviricetes sp.]
MNDDVKDVVNAEEYGITAEDLKDVDIDDKSTDVTDEPTGEQSDTPLNSESEPSSEGNTEVEEVNVTEENHGDLNKALAAERKRRKEAEKKLNEFRQQSAPVTLTAEEVSNINEFAKKTAMQQFGIDNMEDLMYTDPEKYAQLLEEQGRIKYVVTQQQQQRMALRNQNIAFIQSIQSADDFKDMLAIAQGELDGMTRAESNPIDAAFARTGAGVGTQQDFDVITKFVERLRGKLNAQAVQEPKVNPLEKTINLPKAGALGGGNGKALSAISNDELLKMVAEGRESELPEPLQRQLKELIG